MPSTIQRLAKAREAQRSYRSHQKQHVVNLKDRIFELKLQVYDNAMYLALIAQGEHLQPRRYCQLRHYVMEMYVAYFQDGVAVKGTLMAEKQVAFWRFTVTTSLKDAILQQWSTYSGLCDDLQLTRDSISQADAKGEYFNLSQTLSFKITFRYMQVVYPHMMQDDGFLAKVMGKTMVYRVLKVVRFGSDNRIHSIEAEHAVAEGWCKLVKDLRLTARILSQKKIDKAGFITASNGEIQDAIDLIKVSKIAAALRNRNY